jgi:hypothetical protein
MFRKSIALLVMSLIVHIGFAIEVVAQKPAKDTSATTTITYTNPETSSPFSIAGDNLGAYLNGTDSVSSIVQAVGNWVLDTKSSTTRTVRIDLGDQVSGPAGPFTSANVPVRILSQCVTNITTLALNATTQCPLNVSFVYGDTTYGLRTGGNIKEYPGTDPVTWKCLGINAGKCVSWEMTPSGSHGGQTKSGMQLLIPASKPRGSDQLLGLYYFSFHVYVITP